MTPNQISGFPEVTTSLPSNAVVHVNIGGLDKKATPEKFRRIASLVKSNTNTILAIGDIGQRLLFQHSGTRYCGLPDNLPVDSIIIVVNDNADGSELVVNTQTGNGKINGSSAPCVLPNYGDTAVISCIGTNRYTIEGQFIRRFFDITTVKPSGTFSVYVEAGEAFNVEWWDGTVQFFDSTAAAATKTIPSSGTRKVRIYSIVPNGPTKIVASSMFITNIKAQNFLTLTELGLANNGISDLDVKGLDNLTKLTVNANPVSRAVLSNLTKLNFLNLSSTGVTSLLPDGLDRLATLYIGNSGLTSFSGAGFANLTFLDLSNSGSLVAFSGVGMPGLERLSLDGTALDYLDTVGLLRLKRLTASGCASLVEFNGRDLRKVTDVELPYCPLLTTLTNFPKVNVGDTCYIDLGNCALQSAQILALYSAVGASPGGSANGISVINNPGAGASTTVATGKGWTVTNGF